MGVELLRFGFLVLFSGVHAALSNIRLRVQPDHVVQNGSAILFCERQLFGLPLYTVKWYRGNREFYRYTPSEVPQTRDLRMHGLFVNMSASNGDQVTLDNLDHNLSGVFSCEVTAEEPFTTGNSSRYIDIIVPPLLPPALWTQELHYQPGQLLRVDCTSSPSKPAANLTVYVNQEPITSSETQLFNTDSGFQWTAAHARVYLTRDKFPRGRLTLKCQARLYEVYEEFSEVTFDSISVDPVPEKRTLKKQLDVFHNSGAAWTPCGLPVLLVLATHCYSLRRR